MLTVILTGGESRRMGKDKALLQYQGKTLLQYQIDKFSEFGDVAVSVNFHNRFQFNNAREVVDIFPGEGPLNGIISGFSITNDDYILLTAVDLPCTTIKLVQKLMQYVQNDDAYVIRYDNNRIEPAFAIYGRACARIARQCIENQKRSFFDLFSLCNVRYINPVEINDFPLEHLLQNINSPDDYNLL